MRQKNSSVAPQVAGTTSEPGSRVCRPAGMLCYQGNHAACEECQN